MRFIEHALRMSIQWSENVKWILLATAALLFLASFALFVVECVGKKKKNTLLLFRVPTEAAPAVVEDASAVQETPAEEKAPAEEEAPAVAEEAPAEEEAPAKEEAPAEEPVAADVLAVVEDDATMASESFLVNGKAIYVRYDRSFRARLIQSADEIKARYSELKNLLLSYGTKARLSWTNETFRIGRQTVAKFGIKGKTLSLYIALTPADYEGSKYSFEDVGEVKRYADVPMRLKLRSARSVKWAAELIADMMAKLGKEQKEIGAENFAPNYETTEALVYQALIKVLATGDGVEGELTPATFEDMRREKFQQVTGISIRESVAAEDAENILEDEVAASFIEDEQEDEEEDVEEIEVVSEDEEEEPSLKAPVEPVTTELPAVPAKEIKPVPAPLTVAVKKPAPRVKKNVKKADRKGPKEIVNIDAISRAFSAGDKVSIDTLQEKKLITRRAGAVKILARGKLDKPLTVVADEFSIQAVKMILLTGGRVVRRKRH